MAGRDDPKSEIGEETNQDKWTGQRGGWRRSLGAPWVRARRDRNRPDSLRPKTSGNVVERISRLCTKVKVAGVEVASTTTFIVFLYVVARYEITHLLAK